MIVKQVEVTDIMPTNAYFYIDEATKHGFLIDPGAEADRLLKIINDNDWTIEKILLTHSHIDHIGAVEKIAHTLNIPYFAHENAKDYLGDENMNLSLLFGSPLTLTDAKYFTDNHYISLQADNNIRLKVIHTPGHTTDSVVFYDENKHIVFTGDTIFKDCIGRTNFPGGNYSELKHSIISKILTLPANTVIYSGHTQATTVEAERLHFELA